MKVEPLSSLLNRHTRAPINKNVYEISPFDILTLVFVEMRIRSLQKTKFTSILDIMFKWKWSFGKSNFMFSKTTLSNNFQTLLILTLNLILTKYLAKMAWLYYLLIQLLDHLLNFRLVMIWIYKTLVQHGKPSI